MAVGLVFIGPFIIQWTAPLFWTCCCYRQMTGKRWLRSFKKVVFFASLFGFGTAVLGGFYGRDYYEYMYAGKHVPEAKANVAPVTPFGTYTRQPRTVGVLTVLPFRLHGQVHRRSSHHSPRCHDCAVTKMALMN